MTNKDMIATLEEARSFGCNDTAIELIDRVIDALSSPCAMTKMGIARRLTAIKASIASCKGADDFYEKHRSNALQSISDFFNALESEPEPPPCACGGGKVLADEYGPLSKQALVRFVRTGELSFDYGMQDCPGYRTYRVIVLEQS